MAEYDPKQAQQPQLGSRTGGRVGDTGVAAREQSAELNNHAGGSNHVIQPGDTLWGISRRTYGSGTSWRRIMEANPNTVHNGGRLIIVGDTLILPQIENDTVAAAGGDGADADAETPAVEGAVAHTSPAEADRLIAEAVGGLVPNLAEGLAAGHVRIVADAEFLVAYDRYFGDDGEYDVTNAFVERGSPEGIDLVWVHRDRGDAGTVIHEAMHLYSNASYRGDLGSRTNEGTTEYFTRIVTDAEGIARDTYPGELSGVNALVAATSQQTLADAYFGGDIAGLRAAASGNFQRWLDAMNAKDWGVAARAFDP